MELKSVLTFKKLLLFFLVDPTLLQVNQGQPYLPSSDPAPQNPWQFETVLNASQTPECLNVPVFEGGATPTYEDGTLKQLQLFLPFLKAYSTVLHLYGPWRYSTHDQVSESICTTK